MKIINKLFKLKTWLFVILPFLILLSYFGIYIYEAVSKSYNVSLMVFAEILLIIGVVLRLCYIVFRCIKRKAIVRGIAVILLIVCFICLRISFTTIFPRYLNIGVEYQRQYDEWKAVPPENMDEFREKYYALQIVKDSQRELGFTLELLHLGSLGALVIASYCAGNFKKEKAVKEEI